tara:strand:- start:53 stop:679 length:627 start_codon:yes stop_codon:yes gene_type:complete
MAKQKYRIQNEEGVWLDEKAFTGIFLEMLKNQLAPYIDMVGGAGSIIVDSTISNALTIEDEFGDALLVFNGVTGNTQLPNDTLKGLIEYATDPTLTTGWVARSIPDKQYVDDSVAGASGGATLRNVSAIATFATATETINCTANTFTVNLPTAVGIQGTTYILVNSGTGVITLDADGTETINGSLTIDISKQYVSRTVQSDGTNWIVI